MRTSLIKNLEYIKNELSLIKYKLPQKSIIQGLLVLTVIFFLIVFRKLFPPPQINPSMTNIGISLTHPLGTDHLGRDIFMLTLYAGLNTLYESIYIWGLSFIIGWGLGIVSAIFYGRSIDEVIVFIAEFIRAFPGLLLILIFLTFYKNIALSLIIMYWTIFWRNSRVLMYEFLKSPAFESAIAVGHTDFFSTVIVALPTMLTRLATISLSSISDILGALIVLDFLSFSGKNNITLGTLFSYLLQGFEGIRLFLPLLGIVLLILWIIRYLIDKVSRNTEEKY